MAATDAAPSTPPPAPPRPGLRDSGAVLVAAGTLVSRILGFTRDAVIAHVLGTSTAADALRAALRIPNLMQNLFGEGALSASFIPVYARLRTGQQDEEAVRVAGAVFTLLALLSSVLVLVGVTWSAELVALLTPGFAAGTRAITTALVRLMFPGVGLLVLSAWCLGVLNSHRRFFLSYVSPAVWNLAIIAAVLTGPRTSLEDAARLVAWGALVGSALQFLVQLPAVLTLVRGMRLDPATDDPHVRTVARNFGPALMSRGVLQVSSFVDLQFATMLTAGSVAALGLAQSITLLPVTLFGSAITAAALPGMSSVRGDGDVRNAALRERLAANQRRIAFFIVPSAAAFLAVGDAIAAALYRSGRFTAADTTWLWAILAGASLGLLASTLARLYSSAFFALQDTTTPFRFALVRVGIGIALAYLLGVRLPGWIGIDPRWGTAGLTLASGIAGWSEFTLLRRGLRDRIGALPAVLPLLLRLWGCALLAAGVTWAVRVPWLGRSGVPHRLESVALLGVFAVTYGVVTLATGIPEATALVERIRRRRGGAATR
ncbi:MAG: murein biosynthesis integral membrane protein MurJ [Gemmatimonadaceae bacterium]|nr:murein biosynthesis integral membrane protein MurJ [Gemmatimonadaceae bacterium]